MDLTFPTLFSDLERHGERTALWGAHNLSYRALAALADKVARDVAPRSLVFCLCQNQIESIAGYIGFIRRQAVPVLLSHSIDPILLNTLIDIYRPQHLYRRQAGPYELVPTGHSAIPLHPSLSLLLSTSGSTGSPKLVRLSTKNLVSNAQAIVQYLGVSPSDRAITTLPSHYSYGLSILHTHLLVGAGVILTEFSIVQGEFWNALKVHEATSFGGVPYTYEMLRRLRFEKMNLPSLRMLTQAGGRLAPALVEEYSRVCGEKGIRFVPMYGQTEATARMAFVPTDRLPEKAGAIGLPIPGGEFWLESSTGSRIEGASEEGELVYRGENVCLGYAESRADLSSGDVFGGVLRTGDIATRDTDGFYRIVGRKSRFLKVFGNRVNLSDLETILSSAGFDCACAGTDDRVKVYGTETSSRELILKLLAERTGLHPSAFQFQAREKIPRGANGKILYNELELADPNTHVQLRKMA
ncbi:MAG: AMP-binding protein [Deltaproteobacteria bacterium]|nr:AMP-binding protein [Deltaproteobacteria bacterium]MBI3295801.1 AMP-binding protein [Deltaproteobacteria bacterium]